jgi:hypothetical protein
MGVLEELSRLEHRLSSGDLRAYEEACADDAVFVMPGMVATKQEAIDGLRASAPWDEFSISDLRIRHLGDEAAALVYRFRGSRGSTSYVADMTSTYVRRASHWLLVIHQQTPASR